MLKERDYNILKFLEYSHAISIEQCGNIFFNGSYEGARRRLKQLEEIYGRIKSFKLNTDWYVSIDLAIICFLTDNISFCNCLTCDTDIFTIPSFSSFLVESLCSALVAILFDEFNDIISFI